MADGKFVSCLRVLTDRLGLGFVVAKDARNADRPNLQEAFQLARAHRAAVVKGAALIVVGTLASAAADAQQVISRTSDYEVTWSNSAFADTSALYAGSYAFGPIAFSNYDFSLYLLSSNAQNLIYYYGGGVTISPSTAPSTPYTSPETILISGNADGFWGFSYNIAAGPGLPVTYGRLGELATLNFDVGGFDDTGFTFGYYTYVYLPGDWTTQGTGPGDYVYHSVAGGFSTPTFTYDASSNATTVFTYDPSFTGDGTGPALRFTLVGTVAPEPATWAMLLFGFVSLGLVGWRASRKSTASPR
jgi:PEP-CTERM motif